ncbi:hypothetical protein [Rhodococcoides kyotonense]|uniref:Uncharacterized protein n=1 Tax=Rhodococcoides kyotonense TaxID=398843 RepID=A0A239N618_9NOCA|nr:hypothetical protein [Rhodococcus kyotonensis]SNT49904.1 hypothetical protein SAMN05421642_12945 [Rhodococcus kyotonensis]
MTEQAVTAQIPYWVAVLTPEERSLGSRRTDPRIDTVFSSVVTVTRTQWAGTHHPSDTTLLAVLAATVGAWQSDRCHRCTSGVLVDVTASDADFFPVRLPSTGEAHALVEEVGRRVAAAPNGGRDYSDAKNSTNAAALARKSGAQISFRVGAEAALHDDDSLTHSLAVRCSVVEVDGVTMVDTEFRWNERVFTRADVDDFERFWEKTLAVFV